MKQTGTQTFTSEDNKFIVICDNTLSRGSLHDYLLELKGAVVETISKAQAQEQEASDAVKAADAKKAEVAEAKEIKEVK